MFPNSLGRAVEGRHRVVGQQKPDSRIVIRTSLVVERSEAIQPGGRPLAGSNTDFKSENLLRQLFAAVEVLQKRPEIGDVVPDRFRMISVRCPARKGFLESMTGGIFPER